MPGIPATGTTPPAAKLPAGTIARYAAGSLATGGFATLPGLVLVYYLTDSLGVTALAAGLIVTLAKIWDVVIDPIIGGLSDRSLARTGTRRGPMLIGAIGLPLAFVLMFAVPSGLAPAVSATWVLVAFIAAATFFSMFQIPYIALPAELTSGYKERTRLLTWRVVVLTIAILLFGAGGPEIRDLFPDNQLLGYLIMAIAAAALLGLSLWVASQVAPQGSPTISADAGHRAFSATHYREGLRALRDSQPFRALLATFMLQGLATGLMLAGAQYVATWVLHDQGAVTILFASLIAPALLFAPVWRWIADRIGKVRTFRIASLLFLVATVALVGMLLFPGMWILAPVGIAGAAYAGMQTMPMAMLPDVMSHDAATSGDPDGRAGVFGGVWTAGETAGMALGSTVLALVLWATGYVESVAAVTVTQPATAISGIALAFSLFPALLMLASLATLRGYRLTERDIEGAAGAQS
ncbi:Na+/melibiose symporter-like transporter [Leucobacter komagatae]|uniref:Na+/melibiose symporter-like transporter n=2 Tax=Leucobacter komagatae TaxID=55969 RepID=A0A542XY72_9MICO|nr:MFS transporter [Leucobacter komagatae]TQL40761.1 Na+/melibiose symporter-like transporter [Leucobacter komagatae]